MKILALLALSACATAESDPVDEFLQDVDAAPPVYEPSIDELVALHCPGVIYADGVQTYKGLSGTYRRVGVAPAGEPTKLVLFAIKDDPDAQGTFSGTRAPATPIAGRFAAIGDNPAIGAAMGFDTNSDGKFDQTTFVLGLRRSFGRVQGLCLAGADKPYLMTRTLF